MTVASEAQVTFVHESSVIDAGVELGAGVKIWHFCHVCTGARIGERSRLGQNVYVGPNVVIGSGVKIQNNVSVYEGTIVEDDVFLGPSCVLTNVRNPRAHRPGQRLGTLIRKGATIGANATLVCGSTIGRHAFVAAGAVVTGDVPDHAFMVGVPARQDGWVTVDGHRQASEPPPT